MSQYNLNGFNRSPYNTKPEYNVSWLTCTLTENITGFIGTASDDYLSVNINERVSFTGIGTPNRYRQATGTETVNESVVVSSVFLIANLNVNENITGDMILPSVIARPSIDPAETVGNESQLGIDANLDNTFEETITPEVWIGVHKNLSAEGYELVSAVSGAESVHEYVCNLEVQLQPGSSIVIDANNYNVLIDGENAIWAQSGDWLDNLNRETISLNIQAASGGSGLTATVLYTERYL